jgi:hypothetical protein
MSAPQQLVRRYGWRAILSIANCRRRIPVMVNGTEPNILAAIGYR